MERLDPPRVMFADTESRSPSAAASSRPGSPGQRIQHFAGDIPPSLSPLDAFAAQSRRLARELQEAAKSTGDKRVSRLPPHVVTKSLNEHLANRPHYFRTLSGGSLSSASAGSQENEGVGCSPEVEHPKARPKSSYPTISHVPNPKDQDEENEEIFVTPREIPTSLLQHPLPPADYFTIPRARSPETVEETGTSSNTGTTSFAPNPLLPFSDDREEPRTSQQDLTTNLSPPSAPFARGASSNKHHNENSDDEYTSSNAGSTFSAARRLSSNSNVSLPRTPTSPFAIVHDRSASAVSNRSTASITASRSNVNFSRPMSSASLTNLRESPKVRPLKRSQLSQSSSTSLDLARTSFSFDEPRPRLSEEGGGMSSKYTYPKHDVPSLPRGRMADRESAAFLGLSTPFEAQEQLFPGSAPLGAMNNGYNPSPSPVTLKYGGEAQDVERPDAAGLSLDTGTERCSACEKPKRPTTSHSGSSSIGSTSSSAPRTSISHGPSYRPMQLSPMPTIPSADPSVSSRSNSTVRPSTAWMISNYQSLSADEHVSKAIDLHQHGDLKESTYHLRIAAKQDHPTGMLLYALACRHGWGMRPSPKEGVAWLRKAMDAAQLEVADDEDPSSPSAGTKDVNEKKAHRAQFALSIYELGVSHLNGWGTEQDKALALRCFEIAGEWGDADALTEAGFCYAEGIGCKKDLRKAAKFYRRAAAKGVSMVGNSW